MVFQSISNANDLLAVYENAGYAWTGIADEKIVFCGGVYPAWAKCGTAWMLSSVITEQHKIFLHRSIKKIIADAIDILKLHRLEITVVEGHTKGCKWAERLGFINEGLMKKYDSHGNNYWRYAIVRGD